MDLQFEEYLRDCPLDCESWRVGLDQLALIAAAMAQVGYSASEEMKLESEQEAEIDGVDPWKAAMQVSTAVFVTDCALLHCTLLF